jgi:RNA-binding protein
MHSRERSQLRTLANGTETLLQIGKSGLTENVKIQLDNALTARQLVKSAVLETSPLSASEAASMLSEATGSEIIQVIGRRFILFRRNPEKAPLLP